MKKLLILIGLLLTTIAQSKDSNSHFSSYIAYLPGSIYSYEVYNFNHQNTTHNYKINSSGPCDEDLKKGKEIQQSEVNKLQKFINKKHEDTLWKIPLERLIRDEKLMAKALSSSVYENDSIILDFKKYAALFNVRDTIGDFILPPRTVSQIDGSWLISNFTIKKDTLIHFLISSSGIPKGDDFQEWLTIYLAKQKFNFFNQINIDPFYSEKKLNLALYDYLRIMNKFKKP